MQAGTSGGLMASECARPITVDRAALYFRDTPFVLSHLGVPWVDEAVALALKFPNVYLGTGVATRPGTGRRRWCSSCAAPVAPRCCSRSNFPTVGHRHALDQLAELEPRPEVEQALLGDTARRCSPACNGADEREPSIGKVYGIPPQPPVEAHARTASPRVRSRSASSTATLDPESLEATYRDNPEYLAELEARVTRGRVHRRGRLASTCSAPTTGTSTCGSTCFDDEPHYHYIHRTVDDVSRSTT